MASSDTVRDVMGQAKKGPVYMPWESGHYDEILVFAFAGLCGAIVGATIINHWRGLRKK